MFRRLRDYVGKPPEKELRDDVPRPTANPLAVAAGYGILSEILADSRTSVADQAMFVAAPFIITAAANAGAEAGAREAEQETTE